MGDTRILSVALPSSSELTTPCSTEEVQEVGYCFCWKLVNQFQLILPFFGQKKLPDDLRWSLAWTTSIDLGLFSPDHFESRMCSWDFFSQISKLLSVKYQLRCAPWSAHYASWFSKKRSAPLPLFRFSPYQLKMVQDTISTQNGSGYFFLLLFNCSEMSQKFVRHAPSHIYPKCLHESALPFVLVNTYSTASGFRHIRADSAQRSVLNDASCTRLQNVCCG